MNRKWRSATASCLLFTKEGRITLRNTSTALFFIKNVYFSFDEFRDFHVPTTPQVEMKDAIKSPETAIRSKKNSGC